MSNTDKVRAQIAQLFKVARQEGVISRFADSLADADEVLSIPGLRVEAEDQTPPTNPIIRREGNMLAYEVAERMRDYMIVPDAEGRRWVKVEPR